MGKMLVLGTAAATLAFGAVGAAHAANPNVYSWSPYTIMAYDAGPPVPPITEHRAAVVEPGYGAAAAAPNGNVPSWSPYTLAPQGSGQASVWPF